MPDYYFQADHLSVGYHGNAILTDVTIGVDRGEILTLIGPNGAGKSTLLKSLAGLLPSLSGHIYLAGRELSDMSGRENGCCIYR